MKIILAIVIFALLTIVTQIGGVVFLLSEFLVRKRQLSRVKRLGVFVALYCLFTFAIVPIVAPWFGREKVVHTTKIQPTNYMTVLLNRNYVKPRLNNLLRATEKRLTKTGISINYLDANFPFIEHFPLLPHLSHDDGEKIDLSLIYETTSGEITNQQKSVSGYGVFEKPTASEFNQIEKCLNHGYWQYDYPKYLTLGTINKNLIFSAQGTKQLMQTLLKEKNVGKIFIEPHLKSRLGLSHPKIRYHDCRAVRHDDHIHVQL